MEPHLGNHIVSIRPRNFIFAGVQHPALRVRCPQIRKWSILKIAAVDAPVRLDLRPQQLHPVRLRHQCRLKQRAPPDFCR